MCYFFWGGGGEHRSKTLHIHAVDYDGNFGIQHSVQDCILGISAL